MGEDDVSGPSENVTAKEIPARPLRRWAMVWKREASAGAPPEGVAETVELEVEGSMWSSAYYAGMVRLEREEMVDDVRRYRLVGARDLGEVPDECAAGAALLFSPPREQESEAATAETSSSPSEGEAVE